MHWLLPVALVVTGNVGWALLVSLIFIMME